ncbi:MAG TPA: hypothetical protein VEC99_18880, partial [Clostridia bacterium]|nr:hypothetical protein [Clostridia bacterium]
MATLTLALAQPGSLDAGFRAEIGSGSYVQAIALQPDGKVVVGGRLKSADGAARAPLARLNPDGSLDSEFNVDMASTAEVSFILLQSDGRVLIAGNFQTVSGVARSRVARLESDGRLDLTFDPGTGPDNEVRAVALQNDGKILLGGSFTNVNRVLRQYVARLNPDGSLDMDFAPVVQKQWGAQVYAFVVQPDGKILVCGDFSQINGIIRPGIVRLLEDGNVDLGFEAAGGACAYVRSALVQPDGKILIGARFTNGSGRLARLWPDGRLDEGFTTNRVLSAYPTFHSLLRQPDGKLIVGGWLGDIDGNPHENLARLTPEGDLDYGFGYHPGSGKVVSCIALQPNGQLLAGGSFSAFDGALCPPIVRVNGGEPVPSPPQIMVQPTNQIGFENTTGKVAVVVRTCCQPFFQWQVNGTNLVGATNAILTLRPLKPTNSGVYSVIVSNSQGVIVSDPAVLTVIPDPGAGGTFETGFGTDGPICGIGMQSDGKFVIGGDFKTYNSVPRPRIARLNPNGSLDSTFVPGNGPLCAVSNLTVLADDKLLITGHNALYDYYNTFRLARLNPDGSLDSSFKVECRPSNWPLAVQPDGRIICANIGAGGDSFSIYRLRADGSPDANYADYRVSSGEGGTLGLKILRAAVQPDNKILVGADVFTRLHANGSVDTSFPERYPAGKTYTVFAFQSDRKILVAGTFTNLAGAKRHRLARLNEDGSVDP